MADALLKYETIDQDQISDIMAGALPRDKVMIMIKIKQKNQKYPVLLNLFKEHK